MFLYLLIFVIFQIACARLLHPDHNPHPKLFADDNYCDAPIAKAKVKFPEAIAGRSKYANQYDMFSGYVNVTEQDWLFYWFFESTASNPEDVPLIVWSNGGPGCTAMEGATTENGPLVLDMIKRSYPLQTGQFSDNPYAWNNHAHILYVDQPRYVGFSMGYGDYVDTSVDAGKDIVSFILGWTQLFPDFQGREVIIAAESYGGHYIPAWANAINDYNDATSTNQINLQGIVIGNGIVDDDVQSNQLYYEFLKDASLLDQSAKPASRGYADMLVKKKIGYAPNYYDWRVEDLDCPACYSYNYTTWAAWFLQPEVLKALNVCGNAGDNAFAGRAGGCINFPNGFDIGDRFDYSQALARSLDRGIPVSLYYGKNDRACNYFGGYAMANELPWKSQVNFKNESLKPLVIGGVEAGQFKQFGGLTYVQIDAAGHMVPMDQPAASHWVLADVLD